jgi:hypothetical protein
MCLFERETHEKRGEMPVIGLDKIGPHWNHDFLYMDEDNREHRRSKQRERERRENMTS